MSSHFSFLLYFYKFLHGIRVGGHEFESYLYSTSHLKQKQKRVKSPMCWASFIKDEYEPTREGEC